MTTKELGAAALGYRHERGQRLLAFFRALDNVRGEG